MQGKKEPGTSSREGNKGFSMPFCFLKLEVKFFQYVAVRLNTQYLKFSKLNARQREASNLFAWRRQGFSVILLFRQRMRQESRYAGAAKVFQCLFAF
jgi:hypothetical protein